MCTKFFSDGEVHKYFNPYDTPYEAFINYMNVLSDFIIRVDEEYSATVAKFADSNSQKAETDEKSAESEKPVRKRAAARTAVRSGKKTAEKTGVKPAAKKAKTVEKTEKPVRKAVRKKTEK